MEKTLKPIIEKIHAREILDSRGFPTVEVEVTASGHTGLSAMKQSPRQLKEAHKAYEKIVDYLIKENYAGNKTDADTIISGMSEEWYYMILND